MAAPAHRSHRLRATETPVGRLLRSVRTPFAVVGGAPLLEDRAVARSRRLVARHQALALLSAIFQVARASARDATEFVRREDRFRRILAADRMREPASPVPPERCGISTTARTAPRKRDRVNPGSIRRRSIGTPRHQTCRLLPVVLPPRGLCSPPSPHTRACSPGSSILKLCSSPSIEAQAMPSKVNACGAKLLSAPAGNDALALMSIELVMERA